MISHAIQAAKETLNNCCASDLLRWVVLENSPICIMICLISCAPSAMHLRDADHGGIGGINLASDDGL